MYMVFIEIWTYNILYFDFYAPWTCFAVGSSIAKDGDCRFYECKVPGEGGRGEGGQTQEGK